MPSLFNPKDLEENDLWMKACVAQPGEVIQGDSKKVYPLVFAYISSTA